MNAILPKILKVLIQLVLLILIMLPQPCLAARGPSRATAEWIRANAPQLEGKNHSVQVVAVKPGAIIQYGQLFDVFTWDDYGNGSWIQALVDQTEASGFMKRYGTSVPEYMTSEVRNKRLDAVVRLRNGEPFLDCRGKRF